MGMPYTVLMPIFAKDILGGGPHSLGFLMGASGVGALGAAICLAMRRSVRGLGRAIPRAAGIFGAGLIAFSQSRWMPLSLLLMILSGFGMIVVMAATNTILQTIVEDDKRGRVMSFYAMAFMGMTPFGNLLAGVLADRIGAPGALSIGGLACVIGAALFARRLPRINTMLSPVHVKMGIFDKK
jgi:MFS family permease